MSSQASFFDWALILGFFGVYAVIGLRARRRSSLLDDYLVMGRRLGPILGTATLAATETGLVTLIYFAEEAYLSGFVALAVAVLAALTMWVVGRTGFIVERLRALKVRTVPEYLESRFNTRVRSVAGLATFVVGVLNMGIFLQVESAFLAIMLGIPASKTLIVMAVILVVVVAYTMLGGMRSVVYTDVAQFLMIGLGAGIATWLMVTGAGGFEGMTEAVEQHHGSAGFQLWEAPRYGGLFLFWTALYYLSGWSSWQPVVARVLSIRDTHTALRLYRISSVFMFLRAALPMVWGIAALAILGTVDQSSTMLPEALLRVLPAKLIGLVTVGFVSASMSTYSSYLLAFSSVLLQDVLAPHMKRAPSGRLRVRMIQGGVLLIGVFIYLWGSFYHFPESIFRYITVSGSLSFAATLTVLAGGLYWKQASIRGAYLAFLGSAVPPIVCLGFPAFDATHAGLLSFLLAPAGLVAGSIWKPR